MGYSARQIHDLAIQRWILRTPVEELAQHVFEGVDLDKPPVHLIIPPPPGFLAARRLKELEQTVSNMLPVTKTPSEGMPFRM